MPDANPWIVAVAGPDGSTVYLGSAPRFPKMPDLVAWPAQAFTFDTKTDAKKRAEGLTDFVAFRTFEIIRRSQAPKATGAEGTGGQAG